MKYCMNCMAKYSDEYEICPDCGFVEETMPNDSRCIPPGSILVDRFIAGMPLSINEWLVEYIGWDALNERKVVISEFLPSYYAMRKIGDVEITVVKHQMFQKYLELLKEKAKLLSVFHMPDNIATVYGTFECNNSLYVTSEYHSGIPLNQYLAENAPISYDRAEQFMLPLLQSLDKLHENGYILGGFSPKSIIMTPEKKLILFSYINSIFFNISEDGVLDIHDYLCHYYPYERLRSYVPHDIIPANDVYSSAMILYEMLGGKTQDCDKRIALFHKSGKDKFKRLRCFHIKIDPNKENAIRNGLYINLDNRTPDIETFITDLTSNKKVLQRAKRKKRVPLWIKIAVPLIACTMIGACCAVFAFRPQETVELETSQAIVPDLYQNTLEKAEKMVADVGLLLEVEDRKITDDYVEGVILHQNVEAGIPVLLQTTIGVTVSMQNDKRIMPNLVGLNVNSAKYALEESGIPYSVKDAYSDTVAKDCVISQSITPYTEIQKSDRVTLVFSKGIASKNESSVAAVCKVSDHSGQTYDSLVSSAGSENRANGSYPFEVQSRVYDPSLPEGTVVSQIPEEGEEQKSDEPVYLVVSTHDHASFIPDVVLMEQQKAINLLGCYGLTASIREANSDEFADGLVMEQDPVAGTEINKDTSLILTVSAGREMVEMPDLIGINYEDATKLLWKASLKARYSYKTNSKNSEDVVLEQSIKPGTMIRKGSDVTVYVSTLKPVFEVPDVIGLEKEQAELQLQNAQLGLKIFNSKGKIVVLQYPEAGLCMKKGDVIVCLGKETEATENDGFGIKITPETVSKKKGEEFILHIEHPGIENLANLDIEPAFEGKCIKITGIKTGVDSSDITIQGTGSGKDTFTVRYEKTVKVCEITVTG